MAEENTIFVGKKGTMAYVLAVVTQVNSGASEITIKARGKAISRAVDVSEIVRNKFLKDLKIQKIATSTEEIPTEEGGPLKVSSIEITMKK
ncbi:DNA-binding protein Alba [Candidatus Micrarchaeota archaeon]|nr:DNA-binding protein Alba [Candidatus Micrarchaeota archaeon]MBU2476557.1 DNA-binding protein Alba [Candidatus Micrarchaeota archaeon]